MPDTPQCGLERVGVVVRELFKGSFHPKFARVKRLTKTQRRRLYDRFPDAVDERMSPTEEVFLMLDPSTRLKDGEAS